MEFQFKEEKFAKQIGYAREKQANLESVKADLDVQLNSANTSIANLKNNEKNANEKIQKLELEAIKDRQNQQQRCCSNGDANDGYPCDQVDGIGRFFTKEISSCYVQCKVHPVKIR